MKDSRNKLRYACFRMCSGFDEVIECTHIENPEKLEDPKVREELVDCQRQSSVFYVISQLLKEIPEESCIRFVKHLASKETDEYANEFWEKNEKM